MKPLKRPKDGCQGPEEKHSNNADMKITLEATKQKEKLMENS